MAAWLFAKEMSILLKTIYKLAACTTTGFGVYITVGHECQYSYRVYVKVNLLFQFVKITLVAITPSTWNKAPKTKRKRYFNLSFDLTSLNFVENNKSI